MASLREKNGIWHIITYDAGTKKPKEISLKTKDYSLAKKICKKENAKKELNTTSQWIDSRDKAITLTHALELYHSRPRKKRKLIAVTDATKRVYRQAVEAWERICTAKYAHQYTREDFELFINYFKNGQYSKTAKNKNVVPIIKKYSVNTVASHTNHLYILFNWLDKNEYLNTNIIECVEEERKEIQVIKEEELKIITDELEARQRFEQSNLVRLAYLCALRRSEVVNMCFEDFDFEKKQIRIVNKKGRRIDFIPMLDDIEFFLRSTKLPARGKLFNYTSPDGINTFWRNTNKYCGFNFQFHSLRRSRATDLANSGVDVFLLQTFMRHKDVDTTLKYYTKADRERIRQGINSKLTADNNLS